MEIVEDFEFRDRSARGKYQHLFDGLLALPPGMAGRFTRGVDFTVEAKKFAVSLRTGMWNRGYRISLEVDGDSVVAVVVGRRDAAAGLVVAGGA